MSKDCAQGKVLVFVVYSKKKVLTLQAKFAVKNILCVSALKGGPPVVQSACRNQRESVMVCFCLRVDASAVGECFLLLWCTYLTNSERIAGKSQLGHAVKSSFIT